MAHLVDWFDENLGEWKKIEVDNCGIPITEDRLAEIQRLEAIQNSRPEGLFWVFDEVSNEWVRHPPFPSWTFNENGFPEPPVAPPEQGDWVWDEDTLSWIEKI